VRRWWLVIALLLSVGVNVGILATLATRRLDRPERQPPPPREEPAPPPGPEEGGPPRASRLADRLGLEGEPRSRFLSLQQQFFEQTVRIRLHMAETQREVRRELMSPEPDRQKIDALLKDSARDFLDLEQALAKNVVATREILDPEQEEEYLRLIARLRPLGAEGFGPRPGRRPGPPPRREGGRRRGRD
jgi:Spy/CpxP family protein refolding chaperone